MIFSNIKKVEYLIVGFLWLIGIFYLLLPSPLMPPPALPGAFQSDEPGDTVQIANVSAYYTNLPRDFVVKYYQKYFASSSWWGLPLITYRLNQPPERIREVLRDTQKSTYVEEIIHPFRETLFVSGFEWNNDPFTAPNARAKNTQLANGQAWQFKVTLLYQPSPPFARIVIYTLTVIAGYFLYASLKQSIRTITKQK